MSDQQPLNDAERRSQISQANARKAQCPACLKLSAMRNYPGLRRCQRCGYEEPKPAAKIVRGKISSGCCITCGVCGVRDWLDTSSHSANEDAERQGYILTRKYGWLCPNCKVDREGI